MGKIGCDCKRNQIDRAIISYTHIMCQLLVTVCKKLKNHYAQNKLPGNY